MKILANDGISPAGKERLESAGFEVDITKVAQEQLANYMKTRDIKVILVRSATKVPRDLIDQLNGQLRLIGRGGVGLDNIDVEYASERGIPVINTPAASTRSVAELVFAHLFGMVRYLFDSNQKMPLEGEAKFKELKKNYSGGTELQGKTLGIIGCGRIGTEVAKMAYALGMNVLAHDQANEPKEIKIDFPDGQSLSFNLKCSSLDDLLRQSDFVSLHISGAGKVVIGKKEIEMMKDNAALVNTARGGLVDEEALLEALDSGKLRYAALDVFINEPTPSVKVLMSPYTSLSPHIGAATLEAQDRIGLELADQIIAMLKPEVNHST
jgi:D-3-phosphoglycerate dehydrogenase